MFFSTLDNNLHCLWVQKLTMSIIIINFTVTEWKKPITWSEYVILFLLLAKSKRIIANLQIWIHSEKI
jgi:hypothetical protein